MAVGNAAPLISGVTFVRNAVLFDYPVVEAIRSILPLVDEYICLVCESDDVTLGLVASITSPKLKIVESDWDGSRREGGRILAEKTDEAIAHARGRWIFYLQADEVIHEDDLAAVGSLSRQYADVDGVDGLLFDYLHFYGTFNHVQRSRKWYAREVRLVKNVAGLRSHGDAQGFRIGDAKPRVVAAGARVFHYGWVRPPAVMLAKMRAFHRLWHDDRWVEEALPPALDSFDFGPMRSTVPFRGDHPAVMAERIARAYWTPESLGVLRHAHDGVGQRVLGWIERSVVGSKVGENRNWVWARTPRPA